MKWEVVEGSYLKSVAVDYARKKARVAGLSGRSSSEELETAKEEAMRAERELDIAITRLISASRG